MPVKIQGFESPNFGIDNVDTTVVGYDPQEQFTLRFDRLTELSDDEALFVGSAPQELVTGLAIFAASAIRAGIAVAEKSGQDSDAILTTSGIDIIREAIMAAVTNVQTRTISNGRVIEVIGPDMDLEPRRTAPEKVGK